MTTQTYLPVFSGFYSTIWEPCEDQEMECINEQRSEKGLPEVDFDAFEWDYKSYELHAVKEFIGAFEAEFKDFVSSITFERIVSPREYNFRNDSVDVTIELTDSNIKAIEGYLTEHADSFAAYLKDRYTSRSGFISSYPNNIDEFIGDSLLEALEDSHKLGSILTFIATNEDRDIELTLFYRCNDLGVWCSNYSELVPD